jgi:uncharacterized membrane protein YkvA (DUF1232 family)
VGDQLEFHPSGLTRCQFDRLFEYAGRSEAMSSDDLLSAARQHLEQTRAAHARNRMINVRLASAIVNVLGGVVGTWDTINGKAGWWLRGAMYYFAISDDDEPDFQSPIGFEDDAEILNACLRFAGRDDLCLNVQDYDDA